MSRLLQIYYSIVNAAASQGAESGGVYDRRRLVIRAQARLALKPGLSKSVF